MKNEDIITGAFRRCVEINKLGHLSELNFVAKYQKISINIWIDSVCEVGNLKQFTAYLDNRHKLYDGCNFCLIKNFFPQIDDFIKSYKKKPL